MPQRTTVRIEQEPLTILATGNNAIEAPFTGKVAGASITPLAAVTGAASPASRTLSVVNHGQTGAGTTVVASLALVGGVNLVAYDERAIPLSTTPSDLLVTAGDILEYRSIAVGGTGLVDPGGTVSVTFERID